MKKIFLLAFVLSICASMNAQKIIAVTDCPICEMENTSAKISKIMVLADTICMVQVDILSLEDKMSFVPKINKNSKLVAGNDTFELSSVIALKQGSTNPSDDQANGYYFWKDFKKNNVYSCLAIFNARLQKGIDKISLTNTERDYYNFENVMIDDYLCERQVVRYIVYPKKKIKLRKNPEPNSPILEKIAKDAILIMDTLFENDAYYKVQVLNTSSVGYVCKKDVKSKVEKVIQSSDLFQLLSVDNFSDSPKVEVFNNSNVVLSITFVDAAYEIQPRSKEVIPLKTEYNWCLISAPGTITVLGTQEFKTGEEYWWEFRTINHEF